MRIKWKMLGAVRRAGRYPVEGVGIVIVTTQDIKEAAKYCADVEVELFDVTAATEKTFFFRIVGFVSCGAHSYERS